MINQHPLTETVANYRPLEQLIPAHWQSGFVNADDGAQIHYTRTGGQKPSLLLLHGVQVNGLTWLRTAQAFEANYDVVMPDFRGHGESGGLETGVTAGRLVKDAVAIIQALGLENPFVVGHSMGADIAGRLAVAYPVRGLVLVDPALQNFAGGMTMPDGELPPWMASIVQTMQALRSQPHAEKMVTGLRLLMPGSKPWDEADYVTYIEGQAQFDLGFFRYVTAMGYLFESPDVIAQIACPILLLTARPMMPVANIEPGLAAFKNNWRTGQHVHFEDSGHAIMFDQFDRFIEVLTRFLSTN